MSFLKKNIQHVRKPTYPVEINWSHPLTKNLQGCWIPFKGSVGTLRDLAKGNHGANENAAIVTHGVDSQGLKSKFANTTQGDGYNMGMPANLDFTAAGTLIQGVVLRTDPGGTGFGRSYTKDNGSTGDQFALIFRSGDGDPFDRRIRFRVNNNSLDSTTQLNAEQYYIIAAQYTNGSRRVYVDGKLHISDSLADGNIDAGGEVEIGGHESTLRGLQGDVHFTLMYDKFLSTSEIIALTKNPYQILKPRAQIIPFPSGVAAALTGTAADTIDEADIVTGGNTIILTLTGDTWVASGGTFDAQRQNIIDGLDSAQSEGTGWNAEVRDKEVVTAVVRTSDTVVTITLTASASYDITAQETITATIPATALTTSVSAVVATPTFTVDQVVAGRIMSSLANHGGLAGFGGIAGIGGGLAG